MYCIKCGQFLSGNAKFCSNCGARVEDSKTGESERIKVMTPAEDMEWDLRVFPSSRQKKSEDVVFDWGSDDLYKHSRYKKEQVNGTEDAEEGFKSSGFKFHEEDDESDNMFASVAGIFNRKKDETPEDNRLFNTIGYNSFFDKSKDEDRDTKELKAIKEAPTFEDRHSYSSEDEEEFTGFKGFSGASGFSAPVRDHNPSIFDRTEFDKAEEAVEVGQPAKSIEFEPGFVDKHKSLNLSEDYLEARRATYEKNYFAADTEQKIEMDKARVFEDLDRKKSQLDAEFDKLIHPSLRDDVKEAFDKERVAEILEEEEPAVSEELVADESEVINEDLTSAEALEEKTGAEASDVANSETSQGEGFAGEKVDDTIVAPSRKPKKFSQDTMVYEKYSAPTIEDIKQSVKAEVKAEAKKEVKEEVLEEAKAKAKAELKDEMAANGAGAVAGAVAGVGKMAKKEKKLGFFARIKNFLAGDDDFEDLDDYQEEVSPVSAEDLKNVAFPGASDLEVESEVSKKVLDGSQGAGFASDVKADSASASVSSAGADVSSAGVDGGNLAGNGVDAEAQAGGSAVEAGAQGFGNSDEIDKFYTFNKKNEEFQKLLDKEYERIERKIAPSGIEDDVEQFMDVHRGPMMEATSQIEEMAKAREAVFSGANVYIEGDNVVPQRSKHFKDGGSAGGEGAAGFETKSPCQESGVDEEQGPTGVGGFRFMNFFGGKSKDANADDEESSPNLGSSEDELEAAEADAMNSVEAADENGEIHEAAEADVMSSVEAAEAADEASESVENVENPETADNQKLTLSEGEAEGEGFAGKCGLDEEDTSDLVWNPDGTLNFGATMAAMNSEDSENPTEAVGSDDLENPTEAESSDDLELEEALRVNKPSEAEETSQGEGFVRDQDENQNSDEDVAEDADQDADQVVVEKYYIEEEKTVLASIVYEPEMDKELQLGEEPVVDLGANIKVNETLAEALKEEDIAKLEAESASDEPIVEVSEEEPKKARVIIEPEKEREKDSAVVTLEDGEIALKDIELVEAKSKMKWVIILLLLLSVAIGVMMGVRYYSPTSMLSKSMDKFTSKVLTLINHDHDEKEGSGKAAKDGKLKLVEDKTQLISQQINRNLNDNIETIVYAKSAKYNPGREYTIEGLIDPKPIQDNTMYEEKTGKTRFVDEEIVGLMIAYASHREEYLNNKGGKVFNLLSSKGSLAKELRIKAASNQKEDTTLLGIGEIKVDGDYYYVWTKEKTNNKTNRYVYRIKIRGNKMKIVDRMEE